MFDVSEDFPGMIMFRLVFLWAANYDELLLKKKKSAGDHNIGK